MYQSKMHKCEPYLHALTLRGTRYEPSEGGIYVKGDSVGAASPNTEEAPFVVGAYGDPSLPRPVLALQLSIRGEHVTARDLDVHRVSVIGKFILLFRLTVHSMSTEIIANNLVVIAKDAAYTAVVECLVYDCDSNDLISIHDSSSGPVGSHHWVVDNIMVGNEGAEQGFDFASEGKTYPGG